MTDNSIISLMTRCPYVQDDNVALYQTIWVYEIWLLLFDPVNQDTVVNCDEATNEPAKCGYIGNRAHVDYRISCVVTSGVVNS